MRTFTHAALLAALLLLLLLVFVVADEGMRRGTPSKRAREQHRPEGFRGELQYQRQAEGRPRRSWAQRGSSQWAASDVVDQKTRDRLAEKPAKKAL
eukprot:TRINITY_DN2064_c0_g1_i1.p2 TRINITY_DN2064_c0_g1~~TRINITY_DN2064_c0_g1_i1.p2  ORF type:complete len:108 (-),score=21.23 TRINITY_DN2064_c0_g1_i1:99-386(-)